MMSYPADLGSIREAAARIAPHAHRTPVLTCAALDALAGRSLFFKCENFQKVGAFKFRGACNAVLKLPDDVAARGVATHSSGNHAQAIALAASIRGIDAHIVMPTDAPAVKRRAVEGYGGRVHPCAPTLDARETSAAAVVCETGATLIPPYDHVDVVAGQGTVALELLDEVSDLDAIVAPIGGGGLLSGICLTAAALAPRIRLLGAEPAGADDAARSLEAGRLLPQTNPKTIADGLLTSLGERTWPVIHAHVEQIITVSDQEIASAMRLVWERMKIVIEPSAAVAVAAVLTDRVAGSADVTRVGVVLSGGNVDMGRLPW